MLERIRQLMPRIIAIAGAGLVIYQWAVARPLWLDEEMIAINIRDRAFTALAGKLSLEQSAPFGWLVLERIALLTFGSGERSLRLLPLVFGLATIATALWMGRRWLNWMATSVLVLACSVGQWVSYSFVELKHYSADAWLGLLVPALAAWAVETDRIVLWWVVAAASQAFGNGGLFVAPLCGAAIVVVVYQRRGAAAAIRAAMPGVVWLAAFAVNYVFVLRPVHTSEFLQSYWQLQFPPTANGAVAVAAWFGERLVAFTVKPGGTRVGWLLWIAAAAGFVLARGRVRVLAVMFATVPLAGIVLTTLHFVPFFERLVLWMVPALYVGIALVSDTGQMYIRSTSEVHPMYIRRATGMLLMTAGVVIAADMTAVGLDDLNARPAATNHRLDDRSAVRWLAAREEPGDVWLTTHLALPAIWWYAPNTTAPIVDVGYSEVGPDCRPGDLASSLGGATRALVFTGFHFDDQPRFFDHLLLDRLVALGQITADRGFGGVSRATIVDRRLTSRRDHGEQLPGCLRTQPAQRW